MRVYFDVCFFLCVCLLFIAIIGETPDKHVSEGLFFFLGFGFLEPLKGEPLINVFMKVYFDVYSFLFVC